MLGCPYGEHEEEYGPQLEMSAIFCWLSWVCPSRPLSTPVHGTHRRTTVVSLVLQLLVGFTQGRSLTESGRREKSEVREYLLLVPPMRYIIFGWLITSAEGLWPSKVGQLNLSFKDQVTSASPHPSRSRNGKP